MIEKKFKDGEKLFGHTVFISDDEKYAIANPHIFGKVTDTVNLLEYLEEKGYNFLFSSGALYFKRENLK